MKEIKDLTLQEVQELLQKEMERGKSFTDENLRYLNEIVITKEMNRFNRIIAFLEDCKKYDIIRIEDGIEPVVFTENIEKKDNWIPVNPDDEDTFPKNDDYILVSLLFRNSALVEIGRYEVDEDGGAFYPGDSGTTYTQLGAIVEAWQPLQKPYREEKEDE